jgi:hypothetical protein
MGDLPDHPGEEAQVLASVLAVVREHPEFTVRDVVEHFRGRPEQDALEAAAAGLLAWNEVYDVEADFLGALAAVRREGDKAVLGSLSGRRPSDLSPEEKALVLASVKARKPDGL